MCDLLPEKWPLALYLRCVKDRHAALGPSFLSSPLCLHCGCLCKRSLPVAYTKNGGEESAANAEIVLIMTRYEGVGAGCRSGPWTINRRILGIFTVVIVNGGQYHEEGRFYRSGH